MTTTKETTTTIQIQGGSAVNLAGEVSAGDCKWIQQGIKDTRAAYQLADKAEDSILKSAQFFANMTEKGIEMLGSDGKKLGIEARWRAIRGTSKKDASAASRALGAGLFANRFECTILKSHQDLYELQKAFQHAIQDATPAKTRSIVAAFKKGLKLADPDLSGAKNRKAILEAVKASGKVSAKIGATADKAEKRKATNAKKARAVANGSADPMDVAQVLADSVMGGEWRAVAVSLGMLLKTTQGGAERFANFAECVTEGIQS
mgnify:CR=1 FL=1